MIHCAPCKVHFCHITNGVVTNATAAGATCDTKGYNYLLCSATWVGADTDEGYNTFQLEECDTTVATSFATISGYKAATDYTNPVTGISTVHNEVMIGLPLTGRKRYIRLKYKATNATHLGAAVFHLFKGSELPTGTADCNAKMVHWG